MHFPWKKSKVARIARLVAGLHQSPKRGGSLVMETGFPTSLVDLFVKNRDRLRKSSKRKYRFVAPPTPPLAQSPCNEDFQSPDMDVGEIVVISRENNDDQRIPFHVAFKVLLAVALAVSTGSLAIWILIAALVLVLIKFAGARSWGFLRPESEIPNGLKSRAGETESPDPSELIELRDELKMESGKETCKSEGSRSSRIKTSLVKRFVPKKLRHGKGKKQGKSVRSQDKEEASSSELEKQEAGVGEEDMVPRFDKLLERVRKGNSGYVILIVLLAGLVGGRGVALFPTLVCCFIRMYTQRRNDRTGKGT
ncbi:hypothetical protein V6N13_033994 [Hibiscus sabdariffa]|uniref:Uncharacterized protein n=1 Tax=Hibiscus sabdariffa TaxID=183260 RepID=A0ABR2F8W7_9ROSI